MEKPPFLPYALEYAVMSNCPPKESFSSHPRRNAKEGAPYPPCAQQIRTHGCVWRPGEPFTDLRLFQCVNMKQGVQEPARYLLADCTLRTRLRGIRRPVGRHVHQVIAKRW